ncbi:hypothetical protein HAX54_016405 [Datura stramonium]|uniref:PWWP domain-containing protein n=1 Tax=Datura stramonium TaxID=4076 RepID=A0ABS8UIS1_DATST|nr:hypothetical protein [Datura stramonium]
MSSEENTEKTKTLAGLSAEALDSETLMADAGTGPGPGLPDEAPSVSQVDHQMAVNGNVDPGATSEPVVATGDTPKVGNELNGDGISLLVEVHRSLEIVGGSGRERVSQGAEAEQGPGHLVEGMNGEDHVADNSDDEMVDGETAEDSSREETGRAKHVYTVGDFVWGKIKSHPWWPGRVYDASDASDFAMKYNQTGRLLVAYFGDGSFSWCPPSQLVPFVDKFEQMSKQSTSKSFLYAVEKALDEISVLVEFDITCPCISEESRAGLSWPLAVNAGIKKGVRVPVGETVSLLLSQCEPAEICKGLKHLARTHSNSNILEFAVLKSWLSAFYRAKCGRPLPLYCEPLQVEGLEDKKEGQVIDANDFSIPIEVPIQGPSEEETPNSCSAKFPMAACDKNYQKRKQKSVAELMGENAKPKGKKTTVEDSTPSSVETSEKKRKKSGEQAKGHTSSSKSVDEKLAKKKSGNTDLLKTKKLSVSIPERDELGDQREMNASPLSRERKKSKYLSPPYTSPRWNAGKSSFKRELEIESQKVSAITRIGERMTKAARLILSSPDANHGDEAVKEKKVERFDDVDKSSWNGSGNSMTFDTMDINSSVNEVLSEVQSTALNPLLLRNGSLEKARGFISTFRNSVYYDGSNYKQYQKVKTGKKRKYLESGNVISHSDTKSPESIPSHAKKRKTKLNKASGTSSQGTEDEDDGRETSFVILMVTFSTGFSLPSEDEIIRIFSKFGDLNEKETKVLCDSNSVQIVYRRGSDAEKAFRESVKQSPFGAANVNFTLSYPSNSEIPLSSLKAGKEKSRVQLIKQKLKGMASILEKCKGKITNEEKSELESEIKGLLEKVSTVTSTNP